MADRQTRYLYHVEIRTRSISLVICWAFLLCFSNFICAQETNLFWGDTHLHTSHSTDSYGTGNKLIDPDLAFRFAKGQPVLHPALKTRIRIPRPLDFLVVADHSDFLGLQAYTEQEDPRLANTEKGEWLRKLVHEEPGRFFAVLFGTDPELTTKDLLDAYRPLMKQPWLDEIDAAERHNEPGKFTSFAGWEWTSHARRRNLHRVIFSASSADTLRSFFPFSSLDSTVPEDLWAWLAATSAKTGADFIAIPHNSNMSTGLMFDMVDSNGRAITSEYARTRARWEPVVEVSQVKGSSEVHPALSPNDEFAEFEIFRRLFYAAEPIPRAGDYARSALLRGLRIESDTGINPYKFGFIGSSDSHTGLSYTDENDFIGAAVRDSLPEQRRAAAQQPYSTEAAASLATWELSASGLAAVWAGNNTREEIAAAFKRKEVYATSGTRISLRVFGGFRFQKRHARGKDIAAIGYRLGVPMGGDLSNAPRRRAPSLLMHASRDSHSANLDRIQVIKGWLDEDGQAHEAIYDAAWSGDRTPGLDGKLEAVGDTVNPESASFHNSIGAAQLATVWQDPDFDPNQLSFYYVRVLEIPTPRHQVYDTVALGMDPDDTVQPKRIQERAWSSPIWYTPAK